MTEEVPPTALTDVNLRLLCHDDIDTVKQLCGDWFPIEYVMGWGPGDRWCEPALLQLCAASGLLPGQQQVGNLPCAVVLVLLNILCCLSCSMLESSETACVQVLAGKWALALKGWNQFLEKD